MREALLHAVAIYLFRIHGLSQSVVDMLQCLHRVTSTHNTWERPQWPNKCERSPDEVG